MAIGTNVAVPFYGTLDPLDDTTTATVADNAASVANDVAPWTNSDDAPAAIVILRWQYATGTINGDIDLHIQPQGIDGTDTPIPTFGNPMGYVGTFDVDASVGTATDQVNIRSINLLPWMTKTSQVFEFFLINRSGVIIAADWDLDIIPMAMGPKA